MRNRYLHFASVCLIYGFRINCESAEAGEKPDYEFSLLKRDGNASVFRVRNNGKTPLIFPIALPASEYGVNPSYVHYEFLKNGRWLEVTNYFHGAYYEYPLNPNRSMSVQIGLNHFHNVKPGTKVRIKWGEYPSKSFRWSESGIRR